MQRLPRKSGCGLFFLLSIFLFITFNPAQAAQETKNKETKPSKDISDAKSSTDEKEIEKGFIYDPTGKTDPFKPNSFLTLKM